VHHLYILLQKYKGDYPPINTRRLKGLHKMQLQGKGGKRGIEQSYRSHTFLHTSLFVSLLDFIVLYPLIIQTLSLPNLQR
jgi:hypothetical protein